MQLQKNGYLTDFVLRLNPLVTKLQSLFLKHFLNFSIDTITEARYRHVNNHGAKAIAERVVRRNKIGAFNQRLLEYIDECHNGMYRDNCHLNIKLQNCLIGYFLKDNPGSEAKSFGDFLYSMERLNQEHRNTAAHSLTAISEVEIVEESGMNSSKIIKKMESLIKTIFKGRYKHAIFDIFETVNTKICDELERSL